MSFIHLFSNLKINLYVIEKVEIGSWWNYKSVNSPFTRFFMAEKCNGETWIQHNGKRWNIVPGSLVVAPPYIDVDYYCEKSCLLYGMAFTAELFSGIQLFTLNGVKSCLEGDDTVDPLLERLLQLNPGKEVPTANPFHKSYDEELRNLSKIKMDATRAFESDSILRLLISRFVTSKTPFFSTHHSATNSRVLKILDYIEKNIDQPLTLPELAKFANLNPTYLSNTFASYLKIRPTTYIKQKRIEKAQRLLISTNIPIKRISHEVGIPNTDYFYRVFKKSIGCTPGDYRDQFSATIAEE